MKTYFYYHSKCYDGFGAAYSAWKKLGTENIEYIAYSHGELLKEMEEDAQIFFFDISPLREVLIELKKTHKNVVVVDHHKYNQKELEGISDCYFDLTHSGAYLSWKYFHKDEEIPEFIKYIEKMDLFKFTSEEYLVCEAIYSHNNYDFEYWKNELEDKFSVESFTEQGKIIERTHNSQMLFAVQAIHMLEISGFKVPAINVKDNVSTLGHLMCKAFPNAPFAALYSINYKGDVVFSLRSIGAFDTSIVAGKYGGGGHPNASGFKIKFNKLAKKNIFNSILNLFTNSMVFFVKNDGSVINVDKEDRFTKLKNLIILHSTTQQRGING